MSGISGFYNLLMLDIFSLFLNKNKSCIYLCKLSKKYLIMVEIYDKCYIMDIGVFKTRTITFKEVARHDLYCNI